MFEPEYQAQLAAEVQGLAAPPAGPVPYQMDTNGEIFCFDSLSAYSLHFSLAWKCSSPLARNVLGKEQYLEKIIGCLSIGIH